MTITTPATGAATAAGATAGSTTAGTAATAGGAPAGQRLLEVTDLKVHFKSGGGLSFGSGGPLVKAVDGVSLHLNRGETLGLVGESGCGKTTAGRAIVRLLPPTSGSIKFDGVELAGLKDDKLRRLRQRFQMIFQDPYSSLNPRMTIGSIIGEPMDIHNIGTKQWRHERVSELLTIVGLTGRSADRFPHEFSGGQRQRVGVARALALNPDLLVADEPISALDVSIRAQILNLLERLQAEFNLAYLVVAHDLAAVRHISDRVAVMYLGRIVEMSAAGELYKQPLHPYTIALLSAVPIPDPSVQQHRRRIILKGDIPSPVNPPPGCTFHTRCWLYERLNRPEECRTVSPELRQPKVAHDVACHFAEKLDGSLEQRQATGNATGGVPAGSPVSTVSTAGAGNTAADPITPTNPTAPTVPPA